MRIGFVTPEYVLPGRWDGGLANYLFKAGQLLADRGHVPVVFVLSDRDKRWSDGTAVIHEVKRVRLPSWIRLRGLQLPLAQYLNIRRLARSVWYAHRAQPLDIVQASSYMAPGYGLLRNGRLPLVCRVSSYTPLLRSAYGRQRSFGEYLCDWLEIRQVIDADASFAPSAYAADTYARLEGFRPVVIRTPVQIVEVDRDESFYQANLAKKRYVLFFGTLSKIKGIDLLVNVIPEVLQRHTNLSFVFIGRDDGLPDGRKMFEFLQDGCLPFKERLHYWPPLPKTQLYPVIAASLGVIMPSRADNYPNACLEAQSLGVPVIGTDNSSLEEMIVDGKTGFLAINGDVRSIVVSLERLLKLTDAERHEMRQHMIRQSQMIAAEDRIGQLIDFYKGVIANSRVSKQ